MAHAHDHGDHFLATQAASFLDKHGDRRAGADVSGKTAFARLEAPTWAAHSSWGKESHQLVGSRPMKVFDILFMFFSIHSRH